MQTVAIPVVRDDPEAYIARDRRRALAAREPMPDRVTGAAIFADISGFTPLTEALAAELGPQRGPEELTAHLGRVFHAVIDELDRRGGDVIYFSGDAITGWLDGDDGSRAVAAATAMQEAMARVGRITTPAGTTVELALKVAVAVGSARRFVVGDPQIQLIDVLAGALIDDLAEAEHHAERGEVVLDESAVAALGDRVDLAEQRRDPESGRAFGVVRGLRADVPAVDVVEPPRLDEGLVRPWLLPAVYERMRAGDGELLAELRPAYPLFLRFAGIDFDDDPDAVEALDELVRSAQRIMSGYGGNLLQLTLGDKGAYLYGVFGSPVAHEDDAARAAAAALELRELVRTTRARDIQIGLARGRLRSGTYGHAMRRTFVCLGDSVNLAARLMAKAPPGRIYVDDRVRNDAGDAYIWERLPDLEVKGKKGAIVAHALNGSLERASRRKTRYELELIGRRDELGQLETALDRTVAGDGRIVGIAAEAGMGKSRLIAEFVRIARRRGLFVALGRVPVVRHERELLRLARDLAPPVRTSTRPMTPDAQRARLESTLAAIDADLVARAPLLASVLGLELPDTELTGSFDAKLRKSSLEDLLAPSCAPARAESRSSSSSRTATGSMRCRATCSRRSARSTAALPVLFVLAYRPEAGAGRRPRDRAHPRLRRARSSTSSTPTMPRRSSARSSRRCSGRRRRRRSATRWSRSSTIGPRATRSTSRSWSPTSPARIDLADEAAMRSIELPESLHSLVLSRIDEMAEAPRRTLKVASVVGRVFEAPILAGAYPDLGELPDVVEQPRRAAHRGPRPPRSGARAGVPVQARGDPGGRLRAACRSRSALDCMPASAPTSRRPTPTGSSAGSTSWPITSGTATTRSASGRTWRAPPMPRGRATRTRPRSTT